MQSGDPQELKKFAREATHWIYNIILSYVQNKEDAEEVAQDTLIAGLNALKDFRKESALKTWMCSIAINKSKDFLKYKTRQKRSGKVVPIGEKSEDIYNVQPTDFMHPGIALESKEMMEVLFAAINQLRENQKTALILAKLENMKQAEIAEVMKLSPKAVESLISRAKANLKKYLEVEGIEIYKKKK